MSTAPTRGPADAPPPSGPAWLRVGPPGLVHGCTNDLRIERVEEPAGFGFSWRIHGLPESDLRRTYVEFTLAPAGGGTRLRVVETGFAQLPEDAHRAPYEAHTSGWARELGELWDHLDAA